MAVRNFFALQRKVPVISMGSYIFGIAVAVGMIVAGLSGRFGSNGSGTGDLLVIVGVVFLVIDIIILIRAKKRGDF